jgi:hypothetical protein
MRNLVLATLTVVTLVVGTVVYAELSARSSDKRETISQSGYACPITGEELPCPNCCPLNQKN